MLGEEEIPRVHCWSRVRKWSMETFFCHKTCGGRKLEGKVVEVGVGYVVTPEPLLFVSKNKPRPFSYQNITFKKKTHYRTIRHKPFSQFTDFTQGVFFCCKKIHSIHTVYIYHN